MTIKAPLRLDIVGSYTNLLLCFSMKIFVKESYDVAIIKITGDDNKVWVNIFIDKAQTAGEDMKHDEILIRTEVGEIKSKFMEEFPYEKEVLFWEYKEAK